MFCENCGAQIEDGSLFCSECGTRVSADEGVVVAENTVEIPMPEDIGEVSQPEVVEQVVSQDTVEEIIPEVVEEQPVEQEAEQPMEQEEEQPAEKKFCPNCGTANAINVDFCSNCGASFSGTPVGEQKKKEKKKLPVIPIVAGVAVVAVVAAGVIVVPKLFKKSSAPIYVKDNEIMSVSGKTPYEFGNKACDTDYYNLGPFEGRNFDITLSEDSKYLFYPVSSTDYQFDLYYRPYGKKKAESTKVAADISYYTVLKNNNVVYKTGDDKLYIWNMKKQEKDKVASDVQFFRISKDGNSIMWSQSDGGESKCYIIDTALKKDKTKILTYSGYICYTSDNFDQIVYTDDSNLYVLKNKEDKTKIKSDVGEVYVLEDGDKVDLFYGEQEDTELSLIDFVDDDMAKEDAHMTEPDIADYQHEEIRQSFWGERTETVTDDAYYDDLDAYYQKMDRDYMRENMKEYTFGLSLSTFYHYDLKKDKEEKLAENVTRYNRSNMNDSVWYKVIDLENVNRAKFSTIVEQGMYAVADEVQNSLQELGEITVCANGTSISLDEDEKLTDFVLWGIADKEAYACVSDGSDRILYTIDVKSSSAKLKEVNDEVNQFEGFDENGFYYTVDESNGEGDLYYNTEKIASDVATGSLEVMENNHGAIFLQDRSKNNFEGTLVLYDGKKTKEIADDATGYVSNAAGNVAFLTDYNWKRYEGDMKIYKNGKIVDVDEDVTAILYFE